MTILAAEHEELRALIAEFREGALSAAQAERLNGLLADSSMAREVFARYALLHASLELAGSVKPAGIDEDEAAATSSDLTAESSPPRLGIVPISTSALPTASFSFVDTAVFSYLVATLLLGMLLLSAWVYKISPRQPQLAGEPSNPAPSIYRDEPTFVGRITGMKDCRWAESDTIAYLGSSVPLGRRYALSAGLMEITYKSGAKVILEGPCTYQVESADSGYLGLGKLTAKVERSEVRGQRSDSLAAASTRRGWPQAANPESRTPNPEPRKSPSSFILHPSSLFSVRTPTAVVTDLGTEFGVEVSKEGTTTSFVFRGSVALRAVAKKRAATDVAGVEPGGVIQLAAGEAARVIIGPNADELKIAKLEASEILPDFVRRLAAPPDKRGEGAYIRAVLADKPLGYWPLNEPAHARRFLDNSGNGFHGMARGDVQAGWSGPFPGLSRAVALNGDGYIEIGRHDRFAMTNGFTVEAWALIEGPTARPARIISVAGGNGPQQQSGWGFGYITDQNTLSGMNPQTYYYFTSYDVEGLWSVKAPLERWEHVVYVSALNNRGLLYVDGELRATYPHAKSVKKGPAWVAIGWSANYRGEFWHGRLAHVAVYPSVLSQAQIKAHFHCAREVEENETSDQFQ